MTIYEINEADGTHYIATELIEGVTLRTMMARGKLTLSELLGPFLGLPEFLVKVSTVKDR